MCLNMLSTLAVNEIYSSYQGEGKTATKKVVFLRLSGCNLACIWCFVGNTHIYTPTGYRKIKDIKVGDLVLSSDGKEILPKKVTKVFEREVTREEIVKVQVEGETESSRVFVTKNHEFYTNRGWINAENLLAGDEINYIDTIAWYMKNANPSYRPAARQRLSELAKKTFTGKRASWETRVRLRASKLGPKNPRYLGDRAEYYPTYLTNWDRIREDILERDNHTCQKCGATSKLEVHHIIPFRICQSHEYHLLITLCKRCHLEEEKRFIRIEKYFLQKRYALHNGKKVVSVTPISVRQAARFNGDSKKIKVYNLEVEDFHSYFANTLLAHNCDTPFTWSWIGTNFKHPEKYDPALEVHKMEIWKVRDTIYALAGDVRSLVVSGGEPMLQQVKLLELFKTLKTQEDWWVEVETNGTVLPIKEFSDAVNQFNCSPKTSNSGPDNPLKDRLKPHILEGIAALGEKATFKFVIQSEADIEEMKAIILICNISPKQVWLMPEGRTKEEQELRQNQVKELAEKFGYNFSPRLHILEFGNKRAV